MKTLDFSELKKEVSIIDVARHLGYSDRTDWARSKKSVRNPCYESASGDKIIITNPFDNSRQVYRNPYDSTDYGDVITFVGKKLNLDAKGITEYLTNFSKNTPLIKVTNQKNSFQANVTEFLPHYFSLSPLSQKNINYLQSRNLSDETLNSPAFKGIFKDVQIPVFNKGTFVKHSDERFIGVTYNTGINTPISAIDYRNEEIKKFGFSSKKSTSIGFSNPPAVIKNILITESPIDAASHYQLQENKTDDTLYIFTGGNLTLGQLLAIDQVIQSQPNEVKTTLLFDKDLAGAIYDLKFLCHRLENSLLPDSFNEGSLLFNRDSSIIPELSIQQSLTSVSLSINTDTLTSDQIKRIFNCESALDLKCQAIDNLLVINVDKTYEEVSKLVELTNYVFPVLSSISIEKTPVGKDWNNHLSRDHYSSNSIGNDIHNPIPTMNTKLLDALNDFQFEDADNKFEIYSVRQDGKIYYHNLSEPTKEFNIHVSNFYQQLHDRTIIPSFVPSFSESLNKKNIVLEYSKEYLKTTSSSNKNEALNPDANSLYDREYTSDFMEALEESPLLKNKQSNVTSDTLRNPFYAIEEGRFVKDPVPPEQRFSLFTSEELTNMRNLLVNEFEKESIEDNFQMMKVIQTEIEHIDNYKKKSLHQQNGEGVNEQKQFRSIIFPDANPDISSQNKMNQMATQNAGEPQTHKTPAEKLQGTMNVLGLKEVWEILKPAFESWSNDPSQDGRKSFKVDNLTFRRTGFKDESKGISTDMLASVELNFNKKNGTVYFNSFTPELHNSIIVKIKEPQSIKHTFDVFLKKEDQFKNLTLKKALNLLDGRSVHLIDDNWLKYDQASKKIGEFKFNLERAIKENKKMDFSTSNPEHMDTALASLLKGDFAMIGCQIDNKQVTIFLTADAQYKKIESHDSNLYRHLSTDERKSIENSVTNKQEKVQGNGMHP